MSINTQPSMEDILEYGLISEFSYLTLESEYFNKLILNNEDGYSNENIKKYLQATEEQIETVLKNERIIIPKE